jgi:undecaprenyl-phosphate galactose phosphotransferase
MPTPRKYPLYKYLLAVLDLLTVMAAYYFAFLFEERWLAENTPIPPSVLLAQTLYVFLIGVVCVFIFHYLGLYQINVFVTLVEHLLQVVKGLAILLSGIAVLSFFTKSAVIVDSRLLILFFALCALALFIVVRISLFRLLYLYVSRNKLVQRNALIIGAGENGRNVAVNLFLHDYTGVQLVGFLDDEVAMGSPVFNGVRVVGKTADMAECVRRFGVEEILVCLEEVEHTHLMELLERTMRLNVIVKVCSPLYEIIPLRRSIEHYGNVPVVGVFQSNISNMNEGYKRTFDMIVAAMTLVLLAPVFAVIATLIKLDSRGPVFYRQVRIGKNGREFKLYKFRSMTVGSDNDMNREKQVAAFITSKEKSPITEGTSTKIVNEAHVTRVGKWLRRFSLDEFPQLINVLRGEMSIVGPRPCLPYEYAHYKEWHKRRMSVLPGLTGMWQVAGRSMVSFEDMVILDLHYIQNASIILDLRVMLKTIPVILFGTGAK